MQHIDRLNLIKALVLLEDEQIVRFNIAANDNASQIHMLVDGLGVGLTHEPVAAGMISHRTACHRSRQHDRPAHSYFYYLSAYQVA